MRPGRHPPRGPAGRSGGGGRDAALAAAPRRGVVHGAVDAGALAAFGDIVRRDEREVELRVAQDQLAALITRLGMLPLADVEVEAASLEDVFMEQYR